MFERKPNVINITAPTRTEYVEKSVTIKEHRAPTDESVRLLKEFEIAAQKKVDDAVRVGNSAFECVVHITTDMMNDGTIYRAMFSLNGRKESAEIFIHRGKSEAIEDVAMALRDEVAKVIATTMIVDAFRGFERSKGVRV
jgi:hypothetical protein